MREKEQKSPTRRKKSFYCTVDLDDAGFTTGAPLSVSRRVASIYDVRLEGGGGQVAHILTERCQTVKGHLGKSYSWQMLRFDFVDKEGRGPKILEYCVRHIRKPHDVLKPRYIHLVVEYVQPGYTHWPLALTGRTDSRGRAWTRRSVCQTAERARCTLNTNILPPNKRGRDLTDCVTCPMYVCTVDRERSERAVFQF